MARVNAGAMWRAKDRPGHADRAAGSGLSGVHVAQAPPAAGGHRVACWPRESCRNGIGLPLLHNRSWDCLNPPLTAAHAQLARNQIDIGPPWGTGPILQGKVNSKMASSFLHTGVGAWIARAGAIVITAALGGALLLNVSQPQPASAQAKKDAKAADAKAPVKAPEGSWVKLCEKNQIKGKDKDGKELTKDVDACVTLTEQIQSENGMVMISAKYHQV